MNKKRYLSVVTTVCLSGAALALLGFILTSKTETSYASPVQVPTDAPDLVINLQAGDETVLASDVISFVLLYTNTLASPLSDVVISSTLSLKQYYTPTYLSDPPITPTTHFTYSGDFDNGFTLEWQLGTLAAGANGWIVVTTTLPPEAQPPWNENDRWPLLGMSAVITTSTPGVSSGNPQGEEGDSASVMVVGPVLRLSKTDDPDPVRPGRLLTYTLTLENDDREDAIPANDIVITDTLPFNTIFHSSPTGIYSPTSPSSGVVIWHLPDPLNPGNMMQVNFTVRLTESMTCQPVAIKNYEENYQVSTDETTLPYIGDSDVSTNVDDVLEKTVETPPLPSEEDEVFPGGIITYTISIYNPRHDQPISGLRLTDTLPGIPDPFIFLDMLTGTSPISSTGREIVWDNLSVDAGGVTNLTFRAQVPEHTYIGKNRTCERYDNELSASVEDLTICDMKDKVPSRVNVCCQVCLDKQVTPDHELAGEIVTYTITLNNVGDTTINSIRLTDTLPSGNDGGIPVDFYYVDMVYGPSPVDVLTNSVVWDGLSVPANDQESISFHAVVIGRPAHGYNNYVSASAPSTSIPDIEKARVTIDSPFTLNKVVNPSEILVGESVEYVITVCNVATGTYMIDQIADELYPGFYVEPHGPDPYGLHDFLDPPVDLGPGECWGYPFDAEVTLDIGCYLPYTYKNLKTHIGIHLEGDDPSFWWVNSVDLAPLLVKPQVEVDKESDHTYVLPGETFVYTITLIGNSDVPINTTIIDTLPGSDPYYFEFVEMVSGPTPVSTSTPTVRWENLVVPALNERVLAFRIQVPPDMPYSAGSQYENIVEGSTTALACVEESDPMARVRVVDEIIEMTKEVDPEEVPPNGIVRYEIELENLDSVPVTGVVVTETLPGALGDYFEFIGMALGDPAPDEVNGPQVIWRNLTVPAETTFRLRFDARAPINFGEYINELTAWCPRSQIIEPEEPEDVEAPVTVLPSVILYKTVAPTQTVNAGILVYTITLSNEWTDPLQSVRITDTLPTGFIYRRMLSGPLPVLRAPPVYAWNLGQVAQGAIEELVFEVQVGYDVISGTYYNKIEGGSPTALIPGVDQTAPVQVESSILPGVYISKTVLPTQTTNGGEVIYAITLLNQRLEVLEDVRITDTLPAGFLYGQMLSGPEPIQESPLVWEIAQLGAGGSQNLTFQTLVGFDVTTGTYSNTVLAYSPYATILGTGEMAPVQVQGTVQPNDVLHKTVSPSQTMSGELVTYTVSLNNEWPQTLDSVRITDTLPAGFSYEQMLSGPNPIQESPIVWSLSQLEEGESQDFVFQAQVGVDVITGTYSNTIEGTSSSAIIPNVGQMAPVEVEVPQWFVFLDKTVFPTQTMNGSLVTYTVTLNNPESVSFPHVRITDTLPAGFLYEQMLSGPEPVQQTSPIVWELDPLDPGTYELVFQALVGSGVTTGTYSNIVSGYSSLARVPGIEMAPVEVTVRSQDMLAVFLPLVLRNYAQ